jgi:glycosyltransferase involved in cell wall biosynthesis
LRVLLIVFNQVGKGTYWRAFHLGRFLAQRGHEVTLLATSPQARFRLNRRDVEAISLVETPDLLSGSLRSGWDLWNAVRRITWLHKQSFDLIHAFETRPVVLLPALVARRRDARLIFDWCDWFGRGGSVEERANPLIRTVLRPVESFFEERFRTRADGTTVINRFLRQKAIDHGVPRARTLVLPNGADLEGIRPGDRNAARQRLSMSPDSLVVAYTGAMFLRDARLMAAAFDQIHAAEPRARLLLIGYCNQAVETMVRARDAVWRTGPISQAELADCLIASDIGWLPLRDTGANRGRFPMKLTDFMAAGLPIAATDVGDIGKLLRDEPIGLLAPDEPGPLAHAALVLLGDAAQRLAFGRRARQVAEARFAWPQIATRAEQFYVEVIKRDAADSM